MKLATMIQASNFAASDNRDAQRKHEKRGKLNFAKKYAFAEQTSPADRRWEG